MSIYIIHSNIPKSHSNFDCLSRFQYECLRIRMHTDAKSLLHLVGVGGERSGLVGGVEYRNDSERIRGTGKSVVLGGILQLFAPEN